MSGVFRPDPVLVTQTEQLWFSSVNSNTLSTYKTGLDCFLRFLIMSGMCFPKDTLPSVNEDMLIFFITHCQKALRLRYETIKTYLAGIRFFYLKDGQNNPLQNSERLSGILRGVKKSQTNTVSKRLPITYDILCLICQLLGKGVFTPFFDLMLLCACKMAYFGFLRCGEFTVKNCSDFEDCLTVDDIVFAPDFSFYTIRLKSSKTDPFRQGVDINIFENSFLNPVSTMKSYFEERTNGLFPNAHKSLFIDSFGRPLSRDIFISHLRQVLTRLGFSEANYSGHSFRIGAATSAAAAGVPDHLIKNLGRWVSDSYLRYIRVEKSSMQAAQNQMCG